MSNATTTLNEQTAARFAGRAETALADAEDLMSGVITVNEAYEGEVENIAVDLRRCGERDLIASYALVGEEAPPELLAHHVITDDTLSALRRIISGELTRIGYLGLWCVYTSKYTLSIDDLRSSQGDTPTYKVNIGRVLEELLNEPTGAGAEGVLRAAKRAQGPYADQLEESHYED